MFNDKSLEIYSATRLNQEQVDRRLNTIKQLGGQVFRAGADTAFYQEVALLDGSAEVFHLRGFSPNPNYKPGDKSSGCELERRYYSFIGTKIAGVFRQHGILRRLEAVAYEEGGELMNNDRLVLENESGKRLTTFCLQINTQQQEEQATASYQLAPAQA